MRSEETKCRSAPIWAIGGGKGGTGKTFVTAAPGALIMERLLERRA